MEAFYIARIREAAMHFKMLIYTRWPLVAGLFERQHYTLRHRVFHRFGQAKFADGDSIFIGSSHLHLLSEVPLKMTLDLKLVKNDSKLIISFF